MIGVLVLGLLLSALTASQAATITASACTAAAIQTAVETAVTGDTVQIPACTQAAWTGTVTITKRLLVQGTGVATTTLSKPAASSSPMFLVQCGDGAVSGVILTAMTLQGTGVDLAQDYGVVLENRCVDFQVHTMDFKEFAHSAVSIVDTGASAGSRGVVWGCNFSKTFVASSLGYGVRIIGTGAYGALSLGTQEAVFVEDNTFTLPRHAVTSNNGSQYVFRHNTITTGQGNAGQIDAHGLSAHPVGSRAFEIYANTLTATSTVFAGMSIRGGDGVIFDNILSGPYSSGPKHVHLTNDGADSPYPRPYQVRSLYLWDNTHEGGPISVVIGSGETTLIQLDRDYFLEARPGYTPFTYPHPLRSVGGPVLLAGASYVQRSQPALVRVVLDDGGNGPILPASGATGFTCAVDASPVTVSSAACGTLFTSVEGTKVGCTLTLATPLASAAEVVTCSYNQGTGNVTDSQGSPQELAAFTAAPVRNLYDQVLNADNAISISAVGDTGRPFAALFDGDYSTEASSWVVSGTAPNTATAVFDFGASLTLNNLILGGDNTGTKQCETVTLESDATCTASYTAQVTAEGCTAKQQFVYPVSNVAARCWRLTVTDDRAGASTGVQVFEANVTVTPDVPPDPPPAGAGALALRGLTVHGVTLQ